MKLFDGTHFQSFADATRKRIVEKINTESEDYIISVNFDNYVGYLFQEFKLDLPILNLQETNLDYITKEIPGSMFPSHEFDISDLNKKYQKQVVRYHIPYTGEIELLKLIPEPVDLSSHQFGISYPKKCILIEVINFYNDADRVKEMYKEEVNSLQTNYGYLQTNFQVFNEGLMPFLSQAVTDYKKKILDKNNFIASLGVPLRKRASVPQIFEVPSPQLREKIVISKPLLNEIGSTPEPTLSRDMYRNILKYINDIGKNLERQPSIYKGKGEEDIRDLIIFVLDPNFEMGSAGGETFNKSGKTDISLRYDSSVVFVAECKFWKGEKAYLKTIDQLLGYLTWRDSKVAVINFVENSEFMNVLQKIKTSTKIHSNFLEELNPSDENWFNYKFHLIGDRNRILDLAVISYHLPKQII